MFLRPDLHGPLVPAGGLVAQDAGLRQEPAMIGGIRKPVFKP